MILTAKAPAKVNLFLKIKGKRPDGYHELLTVYQSIALYDTVHLHVGSPGLSMTAPDSLPQHRENLAYKAADLFYSTVGISPEVAIGLEKRIPVEAGLGGGSSDAAAVLRGLNTLYSNPLTQGALLELAANLGSDVPFFLYGGTAIGTGRGEIIEPLADLPEVWLRLIKPPFGLSTPLVYMAWDGTSHADYKCFSQSLRGPIEDLQLSNDLEIPAMSLRPEIGEFKRMLLQDGAVQALLSGSGSTVFGLYTCQPALDMQLPSGYQQWTVKTLSRSEVDQGYRMGKECITLG